MTRALRNHEVQIRSSLIFLLSFAFFLIGIEFESYWIDEMVSLYFAKNLSLNVMTWDNHPPLYILILRIWIELFGLSELGTRSLSSLIMSLIATLLFYSIRLKGKILNSYLAVVLFCLNPVTIRLAHDSRMYPLLALFTFLTVWITSSTEFKKQQSLVGLIGTLGLLTHLFFAPIFISLVAVSNNIKAKQKFFYLAAGIIFSSFFFLMFFRTHSLSWQVLSFQWPLGNWMSSELGLFFSQSYLKIVLFSAIFIIFLITKNNQNHKALFVLIVLNGLFIIIVSLLMERSFFFYRYFFHFFPSLLYLGFSYSDKPVMDNLKILISTLIILLGVSNIKIGYLPHKIDWRKASLIITEFEQDSCVISSKSLGLSTPYFSKNEKFFKVLNPQAHLEISLQCLHEKGVVWFLDDYWGGLLTIENTLENLRAKNRLQVIDYSFISANSDLVRVIQVRRVQN